MQGKSFLCRATIVVCLFVLVSTRVLATDSYEPNDDPDQAHRLTNGETVESWISTSNDVDWFFFTHASPGLMRIDLTSLPHDYDLELYWFDPKKGTLVLVARSENPGTEDELITGTVDTIGDYFILVYGFEGAFDPDDSYLLRAEFQETPSPVRNLSWGSIKSEFHRPGRSDPQDARTPKP